MVVSESQNWVARRTGLSGPESMLAVVGLEVTTEGIRTGTGTERWRESVPDFRGCDAKAARAKWCADKRSREEKVSTSWTPIATIQYTCQYVVPWAQPIPDPKRHLDRFSRFCSKVKSKVSKRSIAVSDSPHRYGNSHAIRDHTVLPATRQRWHSRLYPSRSWYSIKRPRRDARLSWPSWLITARDGIHARRRSPIPVVTGPDVR